LQSEKLSPAAAGEIRLGIQKEMFMQTALPTKSRHFKLLNHERKFTFKFFRRRLFSSIKQFCEKLPRKINSEFILINFFCCLCTDREFCGTFPGKVKFNIFSRASGKLRFFSFIFDYQRRTFSSIALLLKGECDNKFDFRDREEKSKNSSPVQIKNKKIDDLFLPLVHQFEWQRSKKKEKSFECFTVNKDNLCNLVRRESEKCRRRRNEIKETRVKKGLRLSTPKENHHQEQ
jgi:hypothetical protein